MPPGRLRLKLPKGRAFLVALAVAAVVVPLALVIAIGGSSSPGAANATRGAAVPGAIPLHPSAPVGEVVREAAVKRHLRKGLRARLRASARPPRTPSATDAPPWAKRRGEHRRTRFAGRVNPLGSPVQLNAAAVGTIVSDEFNAPTLDTSLWAFVNPVGDVGLSMTGTHAQLSLPAGVRHDLWTSADEVPRLMQAAPNTDFEVEVKWNSGPSDGYQLQGIMVQQDADDMLRIETLHDGGGSKLFIARIAGSSASVIHYGNTAGGAPAYMRVKREGSFWTVSTSGDGSNWTTGATFNHDITLNSIGPYAGNSGSNPPAFTSRIDYFRAIAAVPLDSTPPVLSGISSAPSGVGATVTWQTDEPATSSVAYGTSTAYTGGVVGQQALVTGHSVTLAGLQCGTVYHYEVRSRDAQGNQANAGDRTFTTGACATTIHSDEFNGSSLDTNVWTFADPVGDVGLNFTGSQAQLSIPAGRRHDLWSHSDEVPKLLQAAPNTDFEVEAKWDSAVSSGFQLQGIIVVQDADDMLRIETHHDGGSRQLFIARVANGEASVVQNTAFAQGEAPLYFRLKRKGNVWTLRTSSDGETWLTSATFTQSLAVSAIGPFGGNSGFSPPAFASKIDYFRDIPPDLTPPAISQVTSAPTGAGAMVTWTTNEPATSEIRYGPTTAYSAGTIKRSTLTGTHSIALHGLACNSTYHFQVRGTDAAGNEGSSADRSLTTAACPDHLNSDEFNGTAIDTSMWTFVDPVGDASLDLTGGQARITLPAGSRHDLWTGADEVPRLLQAAPDSDFEVEAKYDSAVTTGYQMQGILVEQDSDDLLRIETHNDGSRNFLFVGSIVNGVASTLVSRQIPSSPSFWLRVSRVGNRWNIRFSHDGDAWSLGGSFDRAMNVSAVGPFAGNSGENPPAFQGRVDYFREITDRTPPVISDVQITPRLNSAIVTWTTDEPASSRLTYGLTQNYGSSVNAAKLDTRHWIRATGLTCGTSYNLRAESTDQLSNTAASTNRTFTTTACGGNGGPEIDVWGGSPQTVGAIGVPQRWANVRGNVYDPQGTASLVATLNGAHPQNITIGPDNNRLERQGDFNVELNRDLLLPGANKVDITAVDLSGNATTRSVTLNWQGLSAGSTPAANGPVLVTVAHGDDALLGMAGIIRRAKLAGRRVYIGVATNGDEPQTADVSGYCGAAPGGGAATAQRGLMLSRETMTALDLLGLHYSTNLTQTELIFLGYPNDGLDPIVHMNGAPWLGGGSGLGRTYGEDNDGSNATCNGELRYLLNGQHSPLTSTALAADFDALLQLTAPSDIYTLADFDGHPDHAEVSRQTTAAVRRLGLSARVHATVVHPHDSGPCMGFSAANWPNPARTSDNPLDRFTPTLTFTAPPVPTCDDPTNLFGWGPLGPPTESVDVPSEMQLTNPQQNLKYRALNVWDTQCPPDNPAHVTCGYFNAFAKKNEFFWDWLYRGQTGWPTTYTANWDSTATIPDKAQIVEGEWTYDAARDGVRPLATGFDRLLAMGQFDWRSYELEVPVTLHWFDPTKGSAGVGLILGWQGHTDYGGLQPRLGHPYGGICGFGRSGPEPALPRLELVRNSGSVEDTIVAAENQPRAVTLGAQYTMKFRRVDLGNGSSRYSCRLWRSSTAEPTSWDLEVNLPDNLASSSQFRGSALLMAHNVDVTFGDARISPLN